ncbi:fasciclin-3 isoform X2 [Microplitis demolitor]|uniref:fasciclin-3 isoform X2 n=1 Tax=Microplitis demolitor TaxID=69319 RepID=UPI0004CD485A|nr:fasciclin-3 isoform X2 [Microplitis demolitor]
MCSIMKKEQLSIMRIIVGSFAVLLLVSAVQGNAENVVEIVPRGQVAVRVGESLRIMCRVGQPVQFCRVEIPSQRSMVLQPNQNANDGIEYYGEGLQTGQCGVYIHHVKEEYNGTFKCGIITNGNRQEINNSLDIIVAKPPKHIQLLLSPGRLSGRDIYKNGEKLEISCSALAGRPAANVSLYLDDQPLGRDFEPTVYNTNVNDESLSVQNVSYALKWSDNGKMIRCVAQHIALDRPQETKRQLEVHFAPQPLPTVELFGYAIGRPGTINVTLNAHPRPRFTWYINGEKINEGSPDASNRLQSSTAVEVAKGVYQVELKIDSVQKSDTEKEYKLEARNDEGAEEYRIRLSTSAEPEGVDLDAGYIIGIVVGILVILLLAFLIIFARATGRWCFAGGLTTRNIGESSDTESAGRYSRTEVDAGSSGRPRRPKIMLTQLFRRNKDKVSGSDTDTMKTVVTVDDEKIPESNGEKVNPEGGLVYAELDLTPREPNPTPPRRVSEDKTEYAEILYTKTDGTEEPTVKN